MEQPNLHTLTSVPFDAGTAELFAEGFSSWIYRFQDDWFLKAAKFPHAYDGCKNEIRVLTALPRLMVQVAAEYKLIKPCSELKNGGACFRPVEGEPCSYITPEIERDIASILFELHHSPVKEDYSVVELAQWEWSVFAPHVDSRLLNKVAQRFQDYDHTFPRQLIHGDFWPGNWLQRGGRITGVIDWENSGLGDVAMDFASFAYRSDINIENVVAFYKELGGNLGANFETRLEFFRLQREFSGLFHAICFPESGELTDSTAKVTDLVNTLV